MLSSLGLFVLFDSGGARAFGVAVDCWVVADIGDF